MRIFKKLSLALFFLLYFIVLWQVVDLRLIYHSGGMIFNFPVFYTEWEYFHKIINIPGGLWEYISNFLAQFFYVGWAGTIIATIQAFLIWVCTGAIIGSYGRKGFGWAGFLPAILLLIVYLMYAYPFGIAMNFLAAAFFAALYLKIKTKGEAGKIILFILLSAILYAIAGGIYAVFAAVCILDSILLRRKFSTGLLLLLCGPVIAYAVSMFVFRMDFIDTFKDFIRVGYQGEIHYLSKTIIIYSIYASIPLTLIGIWIAGFFKKQGDNPVKVVKKKKNILDLLIEWGKIAGIPAAATAASVIAVFVFHDERVKGLIAVDYYSSKNNWQQVFDIANKQAYSIYINHAVNRALYHTDKLTTDMFAYQQNPEGLMLSKESATPLGWWRLADTYIDLGHMNLAEIALNEIEDLYGERPSFLKRFALIAMVKGDTESARIYLTALNKTLFDKTYAKEYLKKIEEDPNLTNDKEIQHYRSIKPAIDRDIASINENIFLDLLSKNSHNRMAFEYLEAFYLSTNQLDKFAGYLELLNNFKYQGIPKLYEEAILIYNSKGRKQLAIEGGQISADSKRRFDTFMMLNSGGVFMNREKLWQDFGDSYFFYYNYKFSGKK